MNWGAYIPHFLIHGLRLASGFSLQKIEIQYFSRGNGLGMILLYWNTAFLQRER